MKKKVSDLVNLCSLVNDCVDLEKHASELFDELIKNMDNSTICSTVIKLLCTVYQILPKTKIDSIQKILIVVKLDILPVLVFIQEKTSEHMGMEEL